MKLIAFTAVLIGALASVVVVGASKVVTFIDDHDIEKIADEVCDDKDGYELQIGRISTIQHLASQLESDPKFSSCKSKFRDSIVALNVALSDQANLCSIERIALFEQFHRDYISTVSKFKEIRKDAGRAVPRMVKLFFMQYLNHVSTVCSESAAKILKFSSGDVSETEDMKKLLTDLGGLEQGLSSIKSYSDIFLVWNLIASLPTNKLNKYVELDKEVKLTVEVSNASNSHNLQDVCIGMAKPYYNVALLPVIRLIDLGYYPESGDLLKQLQQDDFSRLIYEFAMVCENLMPVRFVENKALPKGKMLLVEVSSALARYGLPEKKHFTGIEISALNSISIPDGVIGQMSDDARTRAKRIKSQVKARGKVMKQLIKTIIRTIKKKPAPTLNALFMGETEEPVSEYVSEVNEQEIPDITEEEEEEEVGVEKEEETGFKEMRNRRSVKSILLAPFKAIGFAAIAIVYFVVVWWPQEICMPAFLYTIMGMYYAIVKPMRKLFG